MTLLLFFHVLFVFVAFGLTTGVGVAIAAIGRSGDPRAIRVGVRAARPMSIAGGILLLLGILVGFATAGKLGIPMGTPWLIASYVMALVLLLVGPFVFLPWQRRLLNAAASSPDDSPSAELLRVANERGPAIAGPISGLMWLGLLYAMIVKP
jgi:Predicted integral membrane protein (DUF2269)